MSVQDDNTIVSKGDLKNLYQNKILPYIGHNVVMSTNNSTYYSTDEKIVGVWTDGKPIYQKTIATSISAVSTAEIVSVGADIDNFISFTSILKVDNGTVLPVNGITTPNTSMTAETFTNTIKVHGFDSTHSTYPSTISVLTTNSNWVGQTIYVTIEYTKTTDEESSASATEGAYDISFPNTWAENTQIYFGNGLYGYRATGNFEATSQGSGSTISLLTLSTTVNIMSFGGSYSLLNSSGSGVIRAAGTNIQAQSGEILSTVNVIQNASKVIIFGYYCGQDYTTTDSTYDIWFTYYTT